MLFAAEHVTVKPDDLIQLKLFTSRPLSLLLSFDKEQREEVLGHFWVEVAVKPVNSAASCLQKSLAWQKGNKGAEGLCESHWPGC